MLPSLIFLLQFETQVLMYLKIGHVHPLYNLSKYFDLTKMWFLWKFRKYAIKDHDSRETLKLRLCDTRGLEEDSSVDPQDIVYILDGHVPDRYQVHAYMNMLWLLPLPCYMLLLH